MALKVGVGKRHGRYLLALVGLSKGKGLLCMGVQVGGIGRVCGLEQHCTSGIGSSVLQGSRTSNIEAVAIV